MQSDPDSWQLRSGPPVLCETVEMGRIHHLTWCVGVLLVGIVGIACDRPETEPTEPPPSVEQDAVPEPVAPPEVTLEVDGGASPRPGLSHEERGGPGVDERDPELRVRHIEAAMKKLREDRAREQMEGQEQPRGEGPR